MESFDLVVSILGLSAGLGAIVEALKRVFNLNTKYAYMVSVVLGMLFGLFYALELQELWVVGVTGGALAGSAASGAYAGFKKMRESKTS